MGRVQPEWCVVNPGERDAKGVEARDIHDISPSNKRADRVVREPGLGQCVREEVGLTERGLASEPIDLYSCKTVGRVTLSVILVRDYKRGSNKICGFTTAGNKCLRSSYLPRKLILLHNQRQQFFFSSLSLSKSEAKGAVRWKKKGN